MKGESTMSNSDIMMVNPAEIVIDLPIDEQNIAQKMESMKERGIIQPVTLWLQGMRVIDGFHRSVAAQRMGWKEIPCYVVDCSEDAFWDARIQSARQHHKIENERLNSWILESWKTTEWYASMSIDPELLEIYGSSGKDEQEIALSILNTLWTLYRKEGKAKVWYEESVRLRGQKGRLSKVRMSDGNTPRKVNPQIVEWIESKARRWGIMENEIVDKLFSFFPRMYLGHRDSFGSYYTAALDLIADELDLTFVERQKLASKIDVSPMLLERDRTFLSFNEWAKQQAKKPIDAQSPFSDYVKIGQDAEREKLKAESEQAKAAVERREQYLQTPQGQAEAHNRKVQTVKEAAERAVWAVKSIEHLLSDSQDFSQPIAEAIASIAAFHNEHFKKKATVLKDLLSAKNAAMRKELKELRAERDSLKRALDSKQVVAPRLKAVMVEHGE